MAAYSAVALGNSLIASNKAARPTPSILGWVQGLTNRSRRPRSNRPLDRMCWRPSRRRRDYQRKNSWPGFHANCLTQSINTRPKAICRRQLSINEIYPIIGSHPGNELAKLRIGLTAPATSPPPTARGSQKRKPRPLAPGFFLASVKHTGHVERFSILTGQVRLHRANLIVLKGRS